MSCNAEQIAEKKRIALERLRQKQQLSATTTALKPSNGTPAAASSTVVDGGAKRYLTGHNNFKFNSNPYKSTTRQSAHPYSKPIQNPSTGAPPEPAEKNVATIFRKIITCSCEMVTDRMFQVVPSGYHEKLVEVFKSIPSKLFDQTTKNWSFQLVHYALLQERVRALNPNVVIGKLPNFIIKLFSEPKPKTDFTFFHSLESTLQESLMPFQREGVAFGVEKQGRCLIADEMGLGKTYQALALADFYKEDWPLLIATNATTRDTWTSTILKLLPYVACHHIVCMTTQNEYFSEAKILIISYALMEKNLPKLLERKFGFVIFDESHNLKNSKTKSAAAAMEIARRARRIVLLTGTPALSRPSELYSQISMIDGSFCNFKDYSLRYCAGKQTRFGWDSSGQSHLTELNLMLSRKFMIRRTKQKVLSELQEKARETIMLDQNLLWNDEETTENMKSYAKDYEKHKGREREEILLKYYSETAHVKQKAVCQYVKTLIKDKQKFIIFAHHMVMLNAIEKCLSGLKVDFIRIDGRTPNNVRTLNVKTFQSQESCRAAVLSIKACNSGITLTATQLVVFAELDWNPSTLAQAESRAHRIGQEGIVTCRYLMGKGTADDIIWEILKKKQNILNQAGIFNEDLSDNKNVLATVTADNNKIDQYLVNKSIDSTTTEETAKNCLPNPITVNAVQTIEEGKSLPVDTTENSNQNNDNLDSFFDGDDEDFENLHY